jgi:hypothetical protein
MPENGGSPPDRATIEVEPSTAEWGARNDRWSDDLLELRQRLERELPQEVEPAGVGEGKLGVELIPIVVALGSAGVFTAMVDVFRAWLSEKPGRREITATIKGPDGERTVTVTGDNVQSGDLATTLQEVVRQSPA